MTAKSEKALEWMKENWSKLVCENRTGEAIGRYYKVARKPIPEAWEDIRSIAPRDEK